MIRHVRHADIDKAAWDRRLAACANALWYGHSAVLDAASPGWDALIDEDSGEQMPIPWRRKHGIRYAYQPFMLQQLGPFAPDPVSTGPLRFLEAWPERFRFADINIRWTAERMAIPGLALSERVNHELKLDRPISELRARYSENHRRSLKKAARSNTTLNDGVTTEEVIAFLEGSEQFKRWKIDKADRGTMRRILHVADASGAGFAKGIRSGGELVAAAYFVEWGGRVIFLKGLSSPKGRELRAMHAIIDGTIGEYAGRDLVFDLAGGNEDQLARFYAGFGAEPVLYLRALMNRLPALIRRMKK